jgi:hypothetical protein
MNRYRLFAVISLTALAAGSFVIVGAHAQTTTSAAVSGTSQPLAARSYSVAREIKIQGTIQSIEVSNRGTLRGTHAQIATMQGMVDAHLGVSPNVNAKTLDLSAGEAVEIIGMMASENGSSVLLARILTTPERIFILRSEQGVPIRGIVLRGNANFTNAATMQGGF